ncbi:DUF699-domain-containing protein [Choiromyces venosus 120613-1]|uniref:DUF699-domain-containing protein n=1 Tax=Choiromyces venosus 120613-1 TaxID=1336337 RepID=A0A3N4JXG2_9PEZI|nr:DUF699-domain-containing protein [Choiromyces venosus 120613-1]
MNLHYILRSADPMQNKSVLWAYKKDFLGFSIIGRSEKLKSRRRKSSVGPRDGRKKDQDPNKPRPKGLRHLNFQEKLIEVANKVKCAAKIMIHKLADPKTACTGRAAIVDASKKMEKFTHIYSAQIKCLSVDEFMDLLKAVVQSLVNGGGEEGAEIADPLLQKPLFAFLDVLKLSETQARTLGLYPILELYRVREEFGDELNPDVFAHITSIRDTLVRKNKASEDGLIDHNYVLEDYLVRMQKRVLSLGNISELVLGDWDKFLEASAPPPKAVPCLVVDDKLNVFPILDARGITALPLVSWEEGMTEQKQELLGLKESHAEGKPVSSLVDISKTVDQAKVIMTFTDTMSEKTLRSTVTLTVGQGRGKSAALGVAISTAIAHSFEALNNSDRLDYDIIQSKSPAFNQAIVRVKTPHQYWQTIQYNQPQDAHILGQAELVVIDEAAAISLLLVQKVMGPYLRFMASTIMGYKGTDRSLSLKLIQQLRE